MTETYKEQLSKHVEGIFKNYTIPGLHICDIATGGGKYIGIAYPIPTFNHMLWSRRIRQRPKSV